METEYTIGRVGIDIKAAISLVKDVGKESFTITMEIFLKGNLSMIKSMVMVL